MRICIVTLFTEEIAGYGKLSAANKKSYAKRHGYDFAVYDRSSDASRHPAFSKLAAMKTQLANHDWVFWSDADSLIMNPDIRLESIIRRSPDSDMILTWESGAAPINTGQWLVRNTPWSAAVLEQIADPDCPNPRPHWLEQGALVGWLEEELERWRHVRVLHPRVMNSTPAAGHYRDLNLSASRYRKGDFIIHFWPMARDVTAVGEAMQQYHQLAAAERSRYARIGALARAAWLSRRMGVR